MLSDRPLIAQSPAPRHGLWGSLLIGYRSLYTSSDQGTAKRADTFATDLELGAALNPALRPGLEFDIVVLDSVGKMDWDASHPGWQTAAKLGKSVGLEWGGDWKGFKDRPHFQYTGGLTLARCRTLYADGLEAVWKEVG